jgi:hypothetical protein
VVVNKTSVVNITLMTFPFPIEPVGEFGSNTEHENDAVDAVDIVDAVEELLDLITLKAQLEWLVVNNITEGQEEIRQQIHAQELVTQSSHACLCATTPDPTTTPNPTTTRDSTTTPNS